MGRPTGAARPDETDPAPHRVLIVDDHRMFVEGLVMLLAGRRDLDLVGTCATGEEALQACARFAPDVVLLDLDLPGMDGAEVTRRLQSERPHVRVVIISAYQDPRLIAECMRSGARGFVPKTHAADEIVGAIRRVVSGGIAMSTRNAADVLGEMNAGEQRDPDVEHIRRDLTPREWEILRLLAEGASTEAIATSLFISPYTVRGHVRGLLSKLQVHSKVEAIGFAYKHGLIPRSS